MKHLIITTEYPPTPFPAGGIGTYVKNISHLLAQNGETVHVITPLWGASKTMEEQCSGKLIIHRIPPANRVNAALQSPAAIRQLREAPLLVQANLHVQAYSMQVSRLAEHLIERESIDIVEAQEYAAPLYDLQLRRALGLGPKRQPPCFVHLHSPTEFIALHNDWEMGRPTVATVRRLEEYSISAGDALLCPSRYLASQVERRFEFCDESIHIIPYPTGPGTMLRRDNAVWNRGTICYVGRLERRKGVLEWIDAAVSVAQDYPDLLFDFIGSNILGTETQSGDHFVQRRIPLALRSQFRFHGEQPRTDLSRFLSNARIAVVPSRWENFPNTCIEAMASGLPVIASRDGGMVEMIRDGDTGWIANSPGAKGLAEALRRAIQTPPDRLAEMGRQASQDIGTRCDNTRVLEAHLAFRRDLVKAGSTRSVHLPANLHFSARSVSVGQAQQQLKERREDGIAIVILPREEGSSQKACVESIERQTKQPSAIFIVQTAIHDGDSTGIFAGALRRDWPVVPHCGGNHATTKNRVCQLISEAGLNPIGLAFLQHNEVLAPEFVSACESVLRNNPQVGLVSGWVGTDHGIVAPPCPSFPFQWLTNDVATFCVIRTDALIRAGYFRVELDEEYDDWDLANAVMADGWMAVTLPQLLASTSGQPAGRQRFLSTRMRRLLLERFPDLVAGDAMDMVLLSHPDCRMTPEKAPGTVRRLHRRILRKLRHYCTTFLRLDKWT